MSDTSSRVEGGTGVASLDPYQMPENPTDVDEFLPREVVYDLPDDLREKLASVQYRSESPSSIRSYLSCPLRWYLERYAEIPQEETPVPSVSAVTGTFVHRVLEMFYSEPPKLRTPELLNRTFLTAWDALKQRSENGIITETLQSDFDRLEENSDDPDSMRGHLYGRAKDCIQGILAIDEYPEQIEVVSTECWVGTKINGVRIKGKVDRKCNSKSGISLVVDDYKTGRIPSEEELEEDGSINVLSDSFIVMGLYALMITLGEDGTGRMGEAVSTVRLLHLKPEQDGYHVYRIAITPQVLGETRELVEKVTDQMNHVAKTGKIVISPANTPSTGHCGWCPASGSCPAWTDGTFTEMRKALTI